MIGTGNQFQLIVMHLGQVDASVLSPCSFGLSATSQQYFSLRTNQPQTTSQ
jgi:hypothetical protein